MKIYCNIGLDKVRQFQMFAIAFMLGGVLVSCDFDRNKPGYSYFPDMEKSQAYDTYSGNTVFADGKTNQMPNANTIARGKMPYHFDKSEENLALAGVELINPLSGDSSVLKEGKRLFEIYCMDCHGEKGDGKGYLYVSGKYPYPPSSLLSERSRNRKDGELFHIISVGFGVMGAHQSIINPDERWKIVAYINKLQ
jgi:mono/diheme cytochrome c family protein